MRHGTQYKETLSRRACLGGLELPGKSCHDIHSIGATHTHSAHAQATRIGGVRVCADHHATGEGVVLQHNLQQAPTPETQSQDCLDCRDLLLISCHVHTQTSWTTGLPTTYCLRPRALQLARMLDSLCWPGERMVRRVGLAQADSKCRSVRWVPGG